MTEKIQAQIAGIPLLSKVPTHWRVNTIKRGFEITLGKMLQPAQKNSTDILAPYLRSVNVRWGSVAVSDVQTMWFGPTELQQLRLVDGDLVVCEGGDAGRASIWRNEIDLCSFQNSVNRVRSAGGNDPRYLMYWLASIKESGYVDIICNKATIAHLTKDKLSNLPMPYPPLGEQAEIATYLDVETARIDSLVNEKKNLCVLIEELRASIICEHITGSSSEEERAIVDSPFILSLPVSWKFLELRRHALIGNGSTPSRENPQFWDGGCFPWLNSSVVNSREITEGSEMVTASALQACHLPIVPAGSVVVALIGQGKTRGTASILRIEATLSQNIAFVTPDPTILDGDFLCWCLTSQRDHLRMISEGRGAGQGALNCDVLARFKIPLPPLDVQKSIVVALNKLTKDMDMLAQHVEREILLLQEVRNATITDAVLGRIDVHATVQNKKELEAA